MSDVMERDVREIKIRVDGIEKGVDLLLRASRKQIMGDLLEFFGRSKDRVKVFLAVNGECSINQIATLLNMRAPNVSKRITELEKEGLIKVKTAGLTKIYEKTEKVVVLKLEKELRKKFGDLVTSLASAEPVKEDKDVQEPSRG